MVEPASNPGTAPQARHRPSLNRHRSKSTTQGRPMYTNFCRVTGTPEELIIDFGLNPQPFGVPTVPIAITQRIVTNFFTGNGVTRP